MDESTVNIENLTTGYANGGSQVVITGPVNASLNRGEMVCLLGPNGSGKSTLLRTLSGFQPALSGVVKIDGRELNDYRPAQLAKVISVVLTERLTVSNMTVEQLVGMGRSPYTGFWGRLGGADRRIVDNALHLVGVGELRKRMIQTLSDGERQKVMIAKAIAQETPIILLDEPTAFLDYPSKVEIMRLLHMLSRERDKLIFLSSHDLELALQIADKVWLVDKRYGLKEGSPEDLSLGGAMELYFAKDGVAFDCETGLFKISNKLTWTIKVEGYGPRCSMLKKALYRNGIGDSENAEYVVKVTDEGYEWGGICYGSIEGVVNVIADFAKVVNEK